MNSKRTVQNNSTSVSAHRTAEATATVNGWSNTIASRNCHNNSWYSGEPGEAHDTIARGSIDPIRQRNRAAWELSDSYTKARNPANDGVRYSYIDDCLDERRRDVSLRFARPTKLPRGTYEVLPPVAGAINSQRSGLVRVRRDGASSVIPPAQDTAALQSEKNNAGVVKLTCQSSVIRHGAAWGRFTTTATKGLPM